MSSTTIEKRIGPTGPQPLDRTGPSRPDQSVALDRTEAAGSARRVAVGDVAPLMAAIVPFSIAIGSTIVDSAVTAWSALAGSVILLAGV